MLLMFCHVVGEVQYRTETGMLKLFAFVTRLIHILGCGLQTFKLARYRQLNKRIGRLIRLSLALFHQIELAVL